MSHEEAITLAKHLFSQYGISGWSIVIENRPKSRMGICRHGRKEIGVSEFHLKDGREAVTNTLLHEIAHALVGPGQGHNAVWKRAFLSMGGSGDRTSKTGHAPEARYIGKCEACGQEYKFYRKPNMLRRRSCHCGGKRFSENHLIHIRKVV